MKIVGKDTNTLTHVNWLFKSIKFTHFSQIYAAKKVSNEDTNAFNKVHEFFNTFSISC